MTEYSVEFAPSAEDCLAEAWLTAIDRTAVRHAQAEIDKKLSWAPHEFGEHQSEGLWRIIVPPLADYYEMDDDRKVVRITDVLTVTPR